MAEEPSNQSSLNSIGMFVLAVILAVTATRSLPIRDTRPNQTENGTSIGSQKSVVYAQLWEDPFQAADRFFQQQTDVDESPECSPRARMTSLGPKKRRRCLPDEVADLRTRIAAIEKVAGAGADLLSRSQFSRGAGERHGPLTTADQNRDLTDPIKNLSKVVDDLQRRDRDGKLLEKVRLLAQQLRHLDYRRELLQTAVSEATRENAGDSTAAVAPTDVNDKLRPAMASFKTAFDGYEGSAEQADEIDDARALGGVKLAVSAEHLLLTKALNEVEQLSPESIGIQPPSQIASANPCWEARGVADAPPSECVRGSDDGDETKQPKIIAVTVNGGSSEGLAENRRRQRYSVVMALKMSGYQPEDQDRIHLTDMQTLLCGTPDDMALCKISPPLGCTKKEQRGCVPFDRFRLSPFDILKPQGRSAEILVLWIRNDDVFTVNGSTSLDILKKIARNVYPADLYPTSSLAVIGPPISSSLEILFRDVSRASPAKPPCKDDEAVNLKKFAEGSQDNGALCPKGDRRSKEDQPHPGLHIFDDLATKGLPFEVQDTLSFNADPSIGMKYRFPECLPGNQGFCFSRTGAPDAGLAKELANELARRHLDSGSFRTLLIVDGGSLFALSLQHHLQDYLSSHGTAGHPATSGDVVVFYFFPGVDGHVSGEFTGRTESSNGGSPSGTHSSEDGAVSTKIDASNLAARATGAMQVDYLRRLQVFADAGKDSRPIGAIGVISTDIYDELLVTQTVRPLFPTALLFTTYLDAQMADPEVINSTRGMVVASNFGLQAVASLGPSISIPAFRDDYETANFLTTLYISQCDVSDIDLLNEAPTSDLCDKLKAVVDPRKPPRIYQIGASGSPLQLTNRVASGLPAIEGQLSWPMRLLIETTFLFAIVGFRYVNLLALGQSSTASLKILVRSTKNMDKSFWASIAAAAVPVVILAFWSPISRDLTEDGQGEGLGWTDGLSLWPAVWLQILACFVAIWFIHLVFCLLDRNTIILAQKFRLGDKQYVVERLRNHKLRFSEDILLREKVSTSVGGRRELKMEDYWQEYYLGRCASISRGARAAALTGFVLVIIKVMDVTLPSSALVTRGRLVNIAYVSSSFLCAVLVFFLVCLVFDATVNSRIFVNRLRGAGETDWPVATVSKYSKSLGFAGARLSDWIDLRFTTTRTAVILVLVWFPFLVIALMMAAKVLSNRIYGAGFIAAISIATLMLMSCVASLRNEAEKQRARALKRLRDLASRLTDTSRPEDIFDRPEIADNIAISPGPRLHQVDLLIERIEGMNEGAFVPTLQQPLIKAILFPIAAGAWPLIEQYVGR